MEHTFDESQPIAATMRGRCVVVSGAAGGIGRGITALFAKAGASVIAADIRLSEVEFFSNSLRAEGFDVTGEYVDVADPVSANALIAKVACQHAGIDVLINNAGIDAPRGNVWEMSDAHWKRIIDVNLSGVFWVTKATIPRMIERGAGRIISISSIAAYRGTLATSAAYNASKAGIVGLTVGLAKQLESYGVLVNAIAPGPTGTGEPMDASEIAAQNAEFPLGFGGSVPVAHACLYLAGPGGDWISGSVLNVSGGRLSG